MTDESYLAMGFRDVDRNSDIGKLLACLRFMERLPSFALYKSRSIDLMNPEPGHTTVDLGCGLASMFKDSQDSPVPRDWP